MNDWKKAQEWESEWHSNCVNSYGEEEKQLLYADRMGLVRFHDGRGPYNFDMKGASVLDIGGGPYSLLLKCVNVEGVVADPILVNVPDWVKQRYVAANIGFIETPAEELDSDKVFNEGWMYNVLQHTEDPELIIQNARKACELIRIFEWIDTSVNVGHIHTLTEENLNKWLGGYGKVEALTGQANCYGRCYYGIFLGR